MKTFLIALAVVGAVLGGALTLSSQQQEPQVPAGVDTNLVAVKPEAARTLAYIYKHKRVALSCVYGEVRRHKEVGRYLFITAIRLSEVCHEGAVGFVAAWPGKESPQGNEIATAWFNERIKESGGNVIFLGLVYAVRLAPTSDGDLEETGAVYFLVKNAPEPEERQS